VKARASGRLGAERRLDLGIAVALVLLAGGLRVAALGQGSLWVDDAWVALAHKAGSLHELRLVGVTAFGFAAILKGWLGIVGFSTLKAQLLPFAFGVAGPALLFVVLRRRGISRSGAVGAGLLLAASPVHITYSTHVKQYTLDAAVAIVLVAVAWRLLDDPGERRRWGLLAAVSAVAVPLSSPSIVLVCCGFAVAWLTLVKRGLRAGAHAVLATLAAAAAVGLWWWLMVAPTVNKELREFFAPTYIPTDEGLGAGLSGALDAVTGVLEGLVALPGGLSLAVLLAAFAFVLWRRTMLGLLLSLPLAVAVGLSALELAPLGVGRTDVYLYPALASLVAVAVHEAAESWSLTAPAALVALTALVVPGYRAADPYPQENIAPLVRLVETRSQPGDAVLVYPLSNFAFGLYTSWPVELVESDGYATGFQVAVQRPDVYVLDPHREQPELYAPTVELISRRHRTVWFIAAPHRSGEGRAIRSQLRERGYRPVRRIVRRGAYLIRWSLDAGEAAGSA
jgi:hypothetical protein